MVRDRQFATVIDEDQQQCFVLLKNNKSIKVGVKSKRLKAGCHRFHVRGTLF